MRPGQIEPNDFELAILERMAQGSPSIRPYIAKLHVLSREFTGVGSYTKFRVENSSSKLVDGRLSIGLISMPGVPNGMGAILFCKNGAPELLEIYTNGDVLWDGVFTGFSIGANA